MTSSTKKTLPLIVLFGRPNTGKSTLFNALTEKNQALVSDMAGTTRDSNIGEVEWQGWSFALVDTGGIIDFQDLKETESDRIESKVREQAKNYLKKADLILFLVDNKSGLLPQDKEMAKFLKKDVKNHDKILLVANKIDNPKNRSNAAEFNKLGLGEPVPISAATGSGTGDLLDVVISNLKKNKHLKDKESSSEAFTKEGLKEEKIKVCIIGQPNAGKSSLLNSMLGYERVIVSSEPHTTREPQDTEITFKDKEFILIDTAGINKKWNRSKDLYNKGIERSLSALKRADVALLVIDLSKDITHQDQKLAEEIIQKKISLIIVANKWDLVEEKNVKKFTQFVRTGIPFAAWAPINFTSAKSGGKNVEKIFDLIVQAAEARKISLGDSQLNKFLLKIVNIHLPSKAKGVKPPHIYELKQSGINPPRFEIRIGSKDSLHYSYLRFIANRLRDKYGFFALPININIRRNRKVHGKSE